MNTQRSMGARVPLVPILLMLLALMDLQTEIRLLLDHFTFSTLVNAIRSHLLATTTLLLLPSLWRHYRQPQKL